jgi:hypothetical protein
MSLNSLKTAIQTSSDYIGRTTAAVIETMAEMAADGNLPAALTVNGSNKTNGIDDINGSNSPSGSDVGTKARCVVIFLHGLGGTGEGWLDFLGTIS